MINKIDTRKVQKFCKRWREDILQITLKELSDNCGVTVPTLSAFECGKSANLSYIFFYYGMCENDSQRDAFMKTLFVVNYEMDSEVLFQVSKNLNGKVVEFNIIPVKQE